MAVSGTPISGILGYVLVSGQTLNMESWTVTTTAGDIDTTGFLSQGFRERLSGLREAKINVRGYWDGLNNPTSDPPKIQAGETVQIYCGLAPASAYSFPRAVITEVVAANNVAERVDFEFTAMSDGPFTYPGQAQQNVLQAVAI